TDLPHFTNREVNLFLLLYISRRFELKSRWRKISRPSCRITRRRLSMPGFPTKTKPETASKTTWTSIVVIKH
ncbi:hypothetical protein scyTo_0018285, partial [Scyliorhinus torazame]|nr:hypothetical protein [Scyliorhinus torazame]